MSKRYVEEPKQQGPEEEFTLDQLKPSNRPALMQALDKSGHRSNYFFEALERSVRNHPEMLEIDPTLAGFIQDVKAKTESVMDMAHTRKEDIGRGGATPLSVNNNHAATPKPYIPHKKKY